MLIKKIFVVEVPKESNLNSGHVFRGLLKHGVVNVKETSIEVLLVECQNNKSVVKGGGINENLA